LIQISKEALIKMHTLSVLAAGSQQTLVRMRLLSFRLVYLTWNKIDFRSVIGAHAGPSASLTYSFTRSVSILMLYLSKRCHGPKAKRPIGRLNSQNCLAIKLKAI